MKCIESFFIIKLMFTFKVEHMCYKFRLHCQDCYTAIIGDVRSLVPIPNSSGCHFPRHGRWVWGLRMCICLGRVRRSKDSNQIADTCVIMSKSHVSYVCAHHVILCNHHQGILYILPRRQPFLQKLGMGTRLLLMCLTSVGMTTQKPFVRGLLVTLAW